MTSGAPDVSVVVTGHHEGELCRPTFAALARTIEDAADVGISVEVVGVLDRADAATVASFEAMLTDEGVIGSLAAARRILVTDHGDPGAARNDGIRAASAPWVCVLDADNLPTRTWIRDALRTAQEHGAQCVVHPEYLLIFGDRWQAWPQLPGDHPGFRVHNFFDRTYWDTFCLASREVFTDLPYARTAAEMGLGPEDWHWGMETIHAGIAHLAAAGTALLYRSGSRGSVQGGHDSARSLLPPSPLLIDPTLPASARERPEADQPAWRGLQRAIVLHSLERPGHTSLPAPAPSGLRRRVRPDHVRFLYPDLADVPDRRLRRLVRDSASDHAPLRGSLSDDELAALAEVQFTPLHYRALNSETLHLDDGAATVHYLVTGRASGLRARLSDQELVDVAGLDLDDYQALHADLAGLEDDDLLHHYLAHGRAEGRAPAMTVEQRDARRQVRLSEQLVLELEALHGLEHDIPEPSPARLTELVHVGPPSDGSMTPGSRAWWEVVEAFGPVPPDVVVFVSQLTGNSDARARTAKILGQIQTRHRVAIVATRGSSTPPPSWDGEVVLIDLQQVTGWDRLVDDERRRLVATLVVQFRPEVVYAVDSPEFSAALAQHGRALRASASIRLA